MLGHCKKFKDDCQFCLENDEALTYPHKLNEACFPRMTTEQELKAQACVGRVGEDTGWPE